MTRTPATGYWLIRGGLPGTPTAGTLGIVRDKPPSNQVQYYLGGDLQTASANLHKGISALFATPEQAATLAQAMDVGAIAEGKTRLFWAPPHQKPGTTLAGEGQTKSGSSAVPVNIIPSPIDPTAGNSHLNVPSLGGLGGLAIRVLEAVGAVLLLVLGLHALIGGENVVTTVGAKAAKAAML